MITSILGICGFAFALAMAITYLITFFTGKKLPNRIFGIVYFSIICEICIIQLLIEFEK
jgi:hypothetical protein